VVVADEKVVVVEEEVIVGEKKCESCMAIYNE
jgi:hypothetical protein